MENLLSIVHLKKYFPLPKKSIFQKQRHYLRANEDISLDIQRGETFGLVGESGCGKSTFGRTLLHLYRPTAGKVIYYGKTEREFVPKYQQKMEKEKGVNERGKEGMRGVGIDLTRLTGKEMRLLRRDLQIIFQDPYSALNPRMTLGQIIEEGVATHQFFRRGSKEMRDYVVEVMKKCGLQEYMLHRYPHQFSGGQRQRICIARALAVKPKFIVCDECVSALDVSIQSQILNLLTELKEKEGLTYLFISHDLSVVRHVSDRIGVMYLGRIVEMGRASDVFERPRHPYTLALISAIPSMDGETREKILLKENLPSAVSPPSGCPFHTRCFMAQECCKRIPAPYVEVGEGHFVACHFADMPTKKKKELAKKNAYVYPVL